MSIKTTVAFIFYFSLFSCLGKTKDAYDAHAQVAEQLDLIALDKMVGGINETEILNESSHGKAVTAFEGFLRLKTDVRFSTLNIIPVLNSDGTQFGAFLMDSLEPAFSGASSFTIKSYYPEYYIVIFEANRKTDGKYAVSINGTTKYIEHIDEVTVYESVHEHLKTSYIAVNDTHPLREEPDAAKGVAVKGLDYSDLSFELIEIVGDWALVVCNVDCEGCPVAQDELTGWVRVLEKGRIVVDLYYVC